MGLIQNLIAKAQEKKAKFNEIEQEESIHKKLDTRKLSANERELNGYLEEERQKKIKRSVENFRKRKTNDFWHGGKVYAQKNLFQEKKNLFRGQNDLLTWQ